MAELLPSRSDLSYVSASEAAALIRTRRISSREYLQNCLDEVRTHNGALNAVCRLDETRAWERAVAADAATACGERWGPLHGLAMTVKDSWMTAGMVTTSGSPTLADFVPEIDAAPVAKLRAAGAVVFGKTNLPIWAGDVQSYNEVYGTTVNPYDHNRTCGGSSGGSAAALAAGLTPLEVGSDIGGSIRGPSSWSGVCGHKPSYGLVDCAGQIPGPAGTLTQADIAVGGPMARTVDDLVLGMGLLAGPRAWDEPAWHLRLPPARHRRVGDYRVAAWLDDDECEVDQSVREVLEATVVELRRSSIAVDEAARPAGIDFHKASRTFEQLLQGAECAGVDREVFPILAQRAAAHDRTDDSPEVRRARYVTQSHADWLRANERRLQHRRRWAEFFTQWDVLLAPAMCTTAIPHDHRASWDDRSIVVNGRVRPYEDLLQWNGIFGYVWLPATVVPVGTATDGLPVGIQVVGPYLEDLTTLAFARHVEALLGGFRRPPGR